jgi:hypothetical protein
MQSEKVENINGYSEVLKVSPDIVLSAVWL